MRAFSTIFPAIALIAAADAARAETYVEEPAFGRPVVGVDVYGGAPIASGDASTTSVGGGGTELLYGYAWEGGASLHGVFGGARWSAKGALGDALGDRDATISEGYAGLAARYAFFDAPFTPFVQALLVSELLRVRGPVVESDPFGVGVGAMLGVRWRDAPLEGFLGFDVRTSRFDGGVQLTRAALALGVFVDLR